MWPRGNLSCVTIPTKPAPNVAAGKHRCSNAIACGQPIASVMLCGSAALFSNYPETNASDARTLQHGTAQGGDYGMY